jgi:hypothetical protein
MFGTILFNVSIIYMENNSTNKELCLEEIA